MSLKTIHQKYNNSNEKLAPISKTDCEILLELIDILTIYELPELVSILNNYKISQDSTILKKLKDFKKQIELYNTAPRYFINIEGIDIEVKYIKMIKKDLNFIRGNESFELIINPVIYSSQIMGSFNNIKFAFFKEAKRDEIYNNIKKELSQFNIKFI